VRWSVFFLVLAPVLAGGVAVYLGRKVARPVALLHAGAERLAAGDLDTRIAVAATTSSATWPASSTPWSRRSRNNSTASCRANVWLASGAWPLAWHTKSTTRWA